MKIGIVYFLLGLLLPFSRTEAQVIFEEIAMKEVLQKAKQENKPVFMDCYTSWCGPCKKMLKEVFNREDVGEYMNSHFINYKMDMEKGEGKELAKAYGIEVYPTFFILDAHGNVMHKMVGGMTAEEFLQKISEGNGENSLQAFKKRYQDGERGELFISKYMELLSTAYMQQEIKSVLHEYWNTLDDQAKYSTANWLLLKRFARDVKSSEYQYLLEHKVDFETIAGEEAVDAKLFGDIYPLVSNHCNDMIFKNRPEDLMALQFYRQLIEKSGVKRSDYLLSLVAFTQAYVSNDISKALKIYRRDFLKLNCDDQLGVTLQLNGMLTGKGSAGQCKQGIKAIRERIKACGWSEENPLFVAVLKGLAEKK